MCSKCSSFMPYHRVCNKSKTTCGIWTVSLPEHPSSPLEVSGVFVARSLVFCVMLCPFVIFLSVIVLSFLLMSCDYLVLSFLLIYVLWLPCIVFPIDVLWLPCIVFPTDLRLATTLYCLSYWCLVTTLYCISYWFTSCDYLVLSFLLMSCDYPFCIFKLFLLHVCHQCLRWNWWINKSNFLLIVSKQKQYLFNCYNKLYFAKCIHLIMLFNVSDRYNINLRTSIH